MNNKKLAAVILIILSGMAMSFAAAFVSEIPGFFLEIGGRLFIVTGMLILFTTEKEK